MKAEPQILKTGLEAQKHSLYINTDRVPPYIEDRFGGPNNSTHQGSNSYSYPGKVEEKSLTGWGYKRD